jgi:hypothetical protein
VNESGVLYYDQAINKSRMLNAEMTSMWAEKAVFSPDGKWLAASHLDEDQKTEIYILNMADALAAVSMKMP